MVYTDYTQRLEGQLAIVIWTQKLKHKTYYKFTTHKMVTQFS